ncbi:MAG: cytidine deaminase [Marinilabiliaceae bacterium]|nr:cytidine deaminase [Marinilabiliaceae bacterium]
MKRKIEIEIDEFSGTEELNNKDSELIEYSMKAAENAYSPYSNFSVGVALRLKSGKIVCGSNRENAAFPSGSCAEDTAISYASAAHPDDPIVSMAISAKKNQNFTTYPVSPCGNCRQIIAEEEDRHGKKIKIILYGSEKIEVINGISSLLPLRFSKDKLKG